MKNQHKSKTEGRFCCLKAMEQLQDERTVLCLPQLIATVHDVSLLDCKTLFRKEQIWFTHKDRDNAYLYSLSESKADKNGIRSTTDLIEQYRRGVFGALPEPDLINSLLEVHSNVYGASNSKFTTKQRKLF